MGQTETGILIFSSVGVIFLLFAAFAVILIMHRNRRTKHELEKETIYRKHQEQLLQHQLDIQTETMQHIGREMHDHVGQKLTLASLYIKQIQPGNNSAGDRKMMEIGHIIDESLADLRQLSKSLTHPESGNSSLYDLLQTEADRINASGICHLAIENQLSDKAVTQTQKHVLYRILQEFIQNSLKHAQCRKIQILLAQENEKVLIRASDNGQGFDTGQSADGIGLHNIKNRARQLNAQYELTSNPGTGTQLKLVLP